MTDNEQTMKRCTKCGEWKPRDEFYKNRSKPDGLSSRCSNCEKAYSREYAREHSEQRREYNRNYYSANFDQIKAQKQAYYAENVERNREYARQYRAADPERARQQNRRYYAAHAEQKRLYRRRYRARNADRIRLALREYSRTNPHVFRAAVQRRKARKLSLLGTLTSADWQTALDAFNGCCAVCGRPPGLWHTIAADHWVPLTAPDCPGTVAWNIVPLCHAQRDGEGGCNQTKSNRDALEWLISTYGRRRGRAIFKRIQDWLDTKKPPA